MENKGKGLAIASLVLGIVGFVFNPLNVVSLVGVILGIVSLATKRDGKGMAIAGLCLCPVAAIWQYLIDTIITIVTMGFGFIAFFI